MNKNIRNVLISAAVVGAAVFAAQSEPSFRTMSFEGVEPNANDIIFDPAKTYTDFYLNKGGTMEDPVIIWGNGAKFRCILLDKSDYVILKDVYVDGCDTFGIRSTGDHVQLLNNYVTNVVRMNLNKTTGKCGSSTSWHAGLRVADATDILVEGNVVENVCGEAVAGLRINGALFLHNKARNGFSVNIYCDQCFDVVIQENISISDDPNYYKDGKPPRGISIGAEKYSGYGFKVGKIDIIGNTLIGTRGINYISEMPGYIPEFVNVSRNVFMGVPEPFISLGSWATVLDSFTATPGGVTAEPTASRTPTVPAATRTATPTRTATSTPAVVPTATANCVPVHSVWVCDKKP